GCSAPAAFPPDIAPAPAQLTSAVPSCTRSLPRDGRQRRGLGFNEGTEGGKTSHVEKPTLRRPSHCRVLLCSNMRQNDKHRRAVPCLTIFVPQRLSFGTHFAASKIKGLTVSHVCPTMQA